MIVGTVTYYAPDGHLASDFDRDVSWAYAVHASKSHRGYVKWESSNGEPSTDWLQAGKSVPAPSFAQRAGS